MRANDMLTENEEIHIDNKKLTLLISGGESFLFFYILFFYVPYWKRENLRASWAAICEMGKGFGTRNY